LLVLGLCALQLACSAGRELGETLQGPELTPDTTYGLLQPALVKVAIVPFAGDSDEATTLVARFVGEALAAHGIPVLQAHDTAIVHDSAAAGPEGSLPLPELAQRLDRELGATSMLIGEVRRYRERVGGEFGASEPASVAFSLTLRGLPGGRRLWAGSFDHTQHELSERPFEAAQLPGGGTRWLTVAELTRFGAAALANQLVASP
jgi:hypothetical protein